MEKSDTSKQLENSAALVAAPWANSAYYSNAERWTHLFWKDGTLFRRLFDEMDLSSALELSCGYGRHSEIVARMTRELTLVDMYDANLDHCRDRLRSHQSVQFIKGNGYSFEPVASESITAIYCYDSMVHFSPDLVESYLKDAARILRPGGMALFHHSNFPAPLDRHYGRNPHSRNHMTKELFASLATKAGLLIRESVVTSWGGVDNLDCVSLVQRPTNRSDLRDGSLATGAPGRTYEMHKTHQSHLGDAPGQTDSSHKLERLKLPPDLSGKSVLDIGCNEGFFCNAVLQRGARKVVGIDVDDKFLGEARKRYADEQISFIKQGWQTLPDGPFDLILWTSAMHYELDPARILPNICSKLSPDGLFVLECGLFQAPWKEMIYNIRHDGGLWYPTLPFLENALSNAGLSYRMVSHAELVGTDPVPRVVFHCSVRQPTVLLVRGPTKSGKTNLAEALKGSATKVISLDYFVSRIAAAKFSHNDLQNFIKKNVETNNLGKIYNGIDQVGLTDAYASLVTAGVAQTDKLVLIEGYMTDLQAQAFTKCLKDRARVWEVGRC